MRNVRLFIKGLKYSEHQTGAYVVVLQAEDSDRTLPIIIGGFEAQSIAIALEKEVTPPRPLTHDLFKIVMDSFSLVLQEVVIVRIKEGVFFANLICRQGTDVRTIDARPSDAISLAVRTGCSIYATEEVLDKAGVILREESSKNIEIEDDGVVQENKFVEVTNPIEGATTAELQLMLNEALQSENYELAARIRDELDKRKK